MEIGSFKFESDKYKAYGAYGAQLLSIYLIRRRAFRLFEGFEKTTRYLGSGLVEYVRSNYESHCNGFLCTPESRCKGAERPDVSY